jgi:hypothetical protein
MLRITRSEGNDPTRTLELEAMPRSLEKRPTVGSEDPTMVDEVSTLILEARPIAG